MWGHYANSHSGFAIAYDMKNYIQKQARNNNAPFELFHLNHQFAPVIYDEKRYDATEHLVSIMAKNVIDSMNQNKQNSFQLEHSIVKDRDLFRVPKIILTKSEEWSYEKEWRLFLYKECKEQANEDYMMLTQDIKPIAIYMGAKITNDNREELLSVCKKKKLDCYQMGLVYKESRFELSSAKVYDGSTEQMMSNAELKCNTIGEWLL